MESWKEYISKTKPRDEIRLNEKLIKATKDRIEQECDKRPELKALLTTPLKDLPEKYLNLYEPSVVGNNLNSTLMDVIDTYLEKDHCICFYSETIDDWLEGFAAYKTDLRGFNVAEIVIFSFETGSYVLARDVKRLLKELTEKYVNIYFSCVEDQPVLEAYKRVTDELNGDYELDDGIWYFNVPGKHIRERKVEYVKQ